jgi:hypothetical protein
MSSTAMSIEKQFHDAEYDEPAEDEISALAHQMWMERGCPEGSPEEDWFRAEEKLRSR